MAARGSESRCSRRARDKSFGAEAESGRLALGCWMLDAECRTPNAECLMLNIGCWRHHHCKLLAGRAIRGCLSSAAFCASRSIGSSVLAAASANAKDNNIKATGANAANFASGQEMEKIAEKRAEARNGNGQEQRAFRAFGAFGTIRAFGLSGFLSERRAKWK